MFRSVLLLVMAVSAYAQTVSFASFSSTSGLTLKGTSAVVATADGNVLRLTPARCCSAGSAFTSSPVPFQIPADTFSTFFQFRITSPAGIDPADGILFVLRPTDARPVKGGGTWMGYDSIGKGLLVKFDTYQNEGDVNDNNVGVQANGMWLEGATKSPYQVASCTAPTGVNGCMANGHLWSVWIDYDGSTLHVALADGSTIRPPDLIQAPLSLPSILNYAAGVYAGLTAGTGGGFENHDIVNWQYDSTYNPTAVGAAQGLPAGK
jgi:legume-like lectin family protein